MDAQPIYVQPAPQQIDGSVEMQKPQAFTAPPPNQQGQVYPAPYPPQQQPPQQQYPPQQYPPQQYPPQQPQYGQPQYAPQPYPPQPQQPGISNVNQNVNTSATTVNVTVAAAELPVNHCCHCCLTFLTGVWLPFWICACLGLGCQRPCGC